MDQMNFQQCSFKDQCLQIFREIYGNLENREIAIIPYGRNSRMMQKAFEEIGMKDNLVAICDNNGSKIGLPTPVDVMMSNKNAVFVVASSVYRDEITTGLKQKGADVFTELDLALNDLICDLMTVHIYHTEQGPVDMWEWFGKYDDDNVVENTLAMMCDNVSRDILRKRIQLFQTGHIAQFLREIPFFPKQYFAHEYYGDMGGYLEEGIYVDCGAYNGDSVDEFIIFTNDSYTGIYAFEPDLKNYRMLKGKESDKIKVFNAAVGKECGRVSFVQADTGSRVNVDADEAATVEMLTLDNAIDAPVSMIKMDIEGSELDALMGAEGIIKEYKPMLAICIYHKWDDIFKIPQYLHEIVPEYSFRVRHHSRTLYETVLYASV